MALRRRKFLKQVGLGVAGFSLASSLGSRASARPFSGHFPRSTPEAQGVSSAGIFGFLEALAKSQHEFHSFMMVRHGHVIAEGWWAPYRADLNQMLYSLSKSFTSTAVGLAASEGKLKVEDRVVSFFPDDLPQAVSDHLAELRVKHLLTMSVGHAQDSMLAIDKSQDWVKAFLALPIPNPPGSVFLYNSGATYMLSAIVQKVTGQKLIDYLRPRLFGPLGIEGMTWESCPRGINTGGWGLAVPTEALARFGQLYLQKGVWDGRPILPAAWVEEATTFKIQQPAPAGADLEDLKRTSDWHQGYCYQFWRCRHNGFRGDGAFGQYSIVLPEKDAVIAVTSESPNMGAEISLFWEHLLPAMKDEALPPDKTSVAALHQALSSLALKPPAGCAAPALAARISGKLFRMEANPMNVESISFHFENPECVFALKDDKGLHPIRCGLGDWVSGTTDMPGTPPRLTARSLGPNSKVLASGVWKDDHTFEMTWRFLQTPHHDTVTCRFADQDVKVEFMNSVTRNMPSRPESRPLLQGRMA
jgi:CubicO group peptidase (beta-lactamase class C family)